MTCHLVGGQGQNTIIDPVISDGYAIIERKRERELSMIYHLAYFYM